MARGFIQGDVERGGNTVITDGRTSTTKVQKSFPLATVTVFNAGTATPSTIFSTEGGAAQANPFLADVNGHWGFWADQARYDVQFSGGGIPSPYTLFNLEPIIATTGLSDPGANGFVFRTAPGVTTVADALFDPDINGIVVRTAEDTTTAVTIQGTTSAIVVTNGSGVLGNPTINLDTNLNFVGKTITGGSFVSPGITDFQNAIHVHENAMGGGQLNASNVFSAGTVPIARLPIMVGATGVTPGTAGLVPAPAAGEDDLFLRGDGTWQAAGGGGGGTPSSPNLSLQYNNGGAFGGVTGTSSDGTQVTWTDGVLRATSPRITTNIKDTNGNVMLTFNALGSAANNFQVANAAAGGHPVLSAVGVSTDINVVVTPKGAGVVSTAGNIVITNNAPQITLVDANDTKTVRMSVNGSNWDFTNDTLGSVPIRISTTDNLVTLAGDLLLSSADPLITLTRTGVAKTWIITVNASGHMVIGENGISNAITIDHTTGICTFEEIPVGPAANPTTANQLVRKQALDDALLPFSINFFEYDPSASTTGTDDRPGFAVPDNVVGGTITKALLQFRGGSALTGGNTIVFTFRRWTSGGAFSDWASVTMTSSHAIQNTIVFDITDQALSAGDIITYYISSRSATIPPRVLTLALQGTWKRVNP